MNNINFEMKLLENGFSGKDINEMRKRIDEYGLTYPTLIKALSRQFIIMLTIITLLILGWFYILFFGAEGSIIPYTLTIFIVLPIVYVFGYVNLCFKSFVYKRKNYQT